LKSDEIVEILDHFKLDVIYEFDRSHENLEDIYWASAREAGFQLRFDAEQRLDTIFLYVEPRDGFRPVRRELVNVPFYSSFREAESEFTEESIPFERSPVAPRWIKGNFGGHKVHYEFGTSGQLLLVTVMSCPAA